MNTQSIRRSVFAALLVAPLSVLAQTPSASKATSPAPPTHPDFRLGKVTHTLTPEQLQTIMNPATNAATEASLDKPLPDVVVSGNVRSNTETKSPIAIRPCGLTSVVWLIEHPADGWRVIAPIAVDSELDACLKPPLAAAVPTYEQF